MLALQVDPRALAEAEAAARWYDDHRPGHGHRFRHKFDELLSRIQDHPQSYQQTDLGVRRALIRRFPFVVVYRVTGSVIQVLAVMPTRSDPALLSLLMSERAAQAR
jgi:plasmid stabilization system protein ParE